MQVSLGIKPPLMTMQEFLDRYYPTAGQLRYAETVIGLHDELRLLRSCYAELFRRHEAEGARLEQLTARAVALVTQLEDLVLLRITDTKTRSTGTKVYDPTMVDRVVTMCFPYRQSSELNELVRWEREQAAWAIRAVLKAHDIDTREGYSPGFSGGLCDTTGKL